jgi:hypothetical protein
MWLDLEPYLLYDNCYTVLFTSFNFKIPENYVDVEVNGRNPHVDKVVNETILTLI